MTHRLVDWMPSSRRYLISAMLLAALVVSGCQKNSETDTSNQTEATETATLNAPVTAAENISVSATKQQAMSQPITILALGDSLTEG